MSGPAPTPTKLKQLRGNPGKRPLNKHEPQPSMTRMYCPRWLDAYAKAEWRYMSGELQRLGLLTKVDRAAFEAYCQTYSMWRRAHKVLHAKGLTFETESGYVQQRPEVAIADKAVKTMKAFLTEFGMTPASRSRISIAPPEAPDPFAAFLAESRVTEALGEDG